MMNYDFIFGGQINLQRFLYSYISTHVSFWHFIFYYAVFTLISGKEFLRVLNELFMDYENLFKKKKYKDIEKIKTIGRSRKDTKMSICKCTICTLIDMLVGCISRC